MSVKLIATVNFLTHLKVNLDTLYYCFNFIIKYLEMYVYSENYPDTYPFNIDQVNITAILFLRMKKEFFY